MRLRFFCCEVLYREACHCIARSPHVVDVKFLGFGLHDQGSAEMSKALQAEIDAVPAPGGQTGYDAILLGYGLCNNGVVGLRSSKHRIVLPRGHDCITLMLGSKEKYKTEFDAHPGTYYLSPGWLEHHDTLKEDRKYVMNRLGMNPKYDELVAKFGEDNAKYVMETLGGWGGLKDYDRIAYIDTGLGPVEQLAAQARSRAEKDKYSFCLLPGDLRLLEDLVFGKWDPDRFLVVEPGQKVRPSYDEGVVKTE